MTITFEIDDTQADWLEENLHDITPSQLAETLLSWHIVKDGGHMPERFTDVVGADDYLACARGSLIDHCDVAENIEWRRARVAGAVRAAFAGG